MPQRCRAAKSCGVIVVSLALAACGSNKEPAQVRIGEIEGTVSAAAGDAATYVPDQLKDVQERLSALEAAYANEDYKGVLSASPAVLDAANKLKVAASDAKLAAVQALEREWLSMSVELPSNIIAVQQRVDSLGKHSGVDLEAARAGLADATSLWSKAQAAFASTNLREAVRTGNTVQRKLRSLAVLLKMDLGAAAPGAAS